jgi:hypothetical protein
MVFSLRFSSLIICCLLFVMCGCSINNNTALDYLSAANTRLISAQVNGADQLAKPELEEAKSLYAEAELALKEKNKEAISIAQKALARARLAEALSKQAKAEAEAEKSNEALKKAQDEANRSKKERIAAENELNKMR